MTIFLGDDYSGSDWELAYRDEVAFVKGLLEFKGWELIVSNFRN